MGPWDLDSVLKDWVKQKHEHLFHTDFYYMPENPMEDPLIKELAIYLDIPQEYIFTCSGISQAIHSISNFKTWERIVITTPEFGLYSLVASETGKEVITIQVDTFDCLIDFYKKNDSRKNDILCFSSPRWFDGIRITKDQLTTLLTNFHGFLFIDEAYIDYSNTEDWTLDFCLNNERIILARSFSKGWYLPGLRTGYIVSKYLPSTFRKQNIVPHSVTSYSIEFIKQMLNDRDLMNHFIKIRKNVINLREYAYLHLLQIDGVKPVNSEANFSCVHFDPEKFNNERLAGVTIEGVKVLNLPEVILKYAIWEKDDIDNMLKHIKDCRI
ncbi:aminotransferase class I/II-fold pyridoxal phosphate-dependent enzyme [Niallia sp. Sow4_A1]|uniref:aminotransferase class I/II-fold pyridoxal phosphate-dependent enzyme n=1 Tax=Bacillaceae TaxID=186817 RepID=UPI0004E24CBA|nr:MULTISPECIES: aminotransferase class I/II-fold pyridoxal phosphate-dependent enzyme [Bacillaceae]MCF2650024.1 aminotransferase class I/II-fold pyridoxal phosphate-dependent enzyme [Niallia circulans]MCM3362638.1 aminotransferase class I/II-fold pyridoxal phosphate-dependent enzyme [Niallia sp. MER TA 168]